MSTGLDKEAIAYLQETSAAARRDALIRFTDRFGDDRQFIYSDAKREYVDVDPHVAVSDTVSNIESFANLVVAEAERRGGGKAGDPQAGEGMNVIFTADGATFFPDTDDRRDVYKYVRQPSTAFKTLIDGLGRAWPHHQFLVWLEKLRTVIGTTDNDVFTSHAPDIIVAFRALKLSKTSKMVSEPILLDGVKGGSFEFKLEVKGVVGGVDVKIPQSFPVSIQFARGDQRRYEFDVLIDINGGEGDSPTITPYAPAVEGIREAAIVDEMREFEETTKQLPKLLCLVNY